MAKRIVVVEQMSAWKDEYPRVEVVALDDYLTDPKWFQEKQIQLVNLCRSYSYLSAGYYCSLLAEARGHRVAPSVRTMLDLGRRFSADLSTPLLEKALSKSKNGRMHPNVSMAAEEVDIFFGECDIPDMEYLARKLFEVYPCPLMRVRIETTESGRRIDAVNPVGLHQVRKAQRALLAESLSSHLGRPWRLHRPPQAARYDLAILHDPTDPLPPSDEKALRKFVRAGEAIGFDVDLIIKKDFSRLNEYDALFIRETTQVAHHTYRFSKTAEAEGLVVLDDPTSILRCTNKVYLAELLRSHDVPTPKTLVVGRQDLAGVEKQLKYPMVLKMPEGAFSSGVFKAKNREEMHETAARLFKESELILAQAYMYTPFDWRIGVLNKKPLFACQYFMSKSHWQIVRHDGRGGFTEGSFKAIHIEDVPEEVMNTALKAAGLIGDGLYGVDLKQTEDGAVYVIEVNDNPNIESGVEDKLAGDAIYETVMAEFMRRIENRLGLNR
ncbi:MAG: RimK family protein [Kiritimatiellia bacterium]|nr:RimK family protein [Kiritimatiellia bacterium]